MTREELTAILNKYPELAQVLQKEQDELDALAAFNFKLRQDLHSATRNGEADALAAEAWRKSCEADALAAQQWRKSYEEARAELTNTQMAILQLRAKLLHAKARRLMQKRKAKGWANEYLLQVGPKS